MPIEAAHSCVKLTTNVNLNIFSAHTRRRFEKKLLANIKAEKILYIMKLIIIIQKLLK